MEQSPLGKSPIVQPLKNLSAFIEPEGSLPCLQQSSTGPYPEPDRSSPYYPILSKIYFNIIHPPTS
jgi:hypothetical protein